MNQLKLYFISYPKIPNSSSLCNFFIVKFVIEIPNYLKIAPFATLPFSQYGGFLLENQWFCGRTCFKLPVEVKYGWILSVFYYKMFLSLVERRHAWYWQIGNTCTIVEFVFFYVIATEYSTGPVFGPPDHRSNSLIEPQNPSHQVSGILCSTVMKFSIFSRNKEFSYVFYSKFLS